MILLDVARGQDAPRTPVWLMRQAGRVLPEYRRVRDSVKDFKTLVKTPELATEVTLQPVDAFGVDAAIIFSDILVIPEAMGLPYEMVEGVGPSFAVTINNGGDIKQLRVAEAEDLNYVMQAITMTKEALNGRVPLIGFAGAPWTIMAYMVEGGSSKTFGKARSILYNDPETAHALLDMITRSTIHYLKGQVAAGADLVQLFDSWGGILSPDSYREFSLKYIRQICEALTGVPRIVFSRGQSYSFDDLNATSCEVVSLDWTVDPREARAAMPDKVLQGNLDPSVLYGGFDIIRRETRSMLTAFGRGKHIANLGHGLYPDIEVDKVKCFVDAMKG